MNGNMLERGKIMGGAFIDGEKIYLRMLGEEDAEGSYFKWMNDKDVTKYLESGFFPATVEDLKNYIRRTYNNNNILMLAIVEKSSDKYIGNIKLEPINWIHRTATLGIMIGEKDCYGKGYATEATRLVVEYAFKRLNLRKISLGVVAENMAAINVYEKIGFEVEGIKKEETYHDGHYCDIVVMGLFKDKFIKQEVRA